MSRKKYRTDFLFAKTGFLIGAGSVLNIAGNYYSFNVSESAVEADEKAIECDWGMTGQDIKNATEIVNCYLAEENG